MTRCQFCNGLSLIDLVARYHHGSNHFTTTWLARDALYQHHPSFERLEQAAEGGCEFCGLIWEFFNSVDGRDTHSWKWPKGGLERQRGGPISVYRLVKELPDLAHSKVRMCINTSQLYGGNIEEPHVLDILMVHVGCQGRSDKELPTLKLKLRTFPGPEDQNLQLGQYRVGSFPVDPHTGSNGNFNLARKWLGACRQQHHNCLSARLPQLPTRVIDVGVHPAYKDVRLRVPQPGSKAEYVALSHCWGGEVTPKLAGGNLEEFTVGLPFATLAANFQDAIKVTRELGIRYLWIDCLCILQGSDQGSRADWERESKAMTAVYRDCTLTISALASSKSTDGFLTYESDICRSAERRLIYIDVVPATTGKSWPAWVEKFDPKKEESLFQLEADGPLARRGWTLQENILSPRHLFYGVNSIHWVCPAGYKSANGMRGMHILDKKYPELSPVLFDGILRQKSQAPKCDAEDILLRYYDLVERYSGRALTVTLDKLPAFSAIAQRLQPILGDYIAGLWRRDIVRGMWWVTGTNAVRPLEYRGPSWSWASMDGNIEFTDTSLLRKEGPLDSQVLDHSICLVDPTNPFGQVRSGSLTARGLTRRLIRSLEYRRDSSEGFDLFYLHFDEPPKDEICHEGLGEQQESPGTLKSQSDLPEHAPNIIDTGRDPKIKLGSYHVISGKYVVFLLRGHQSHYSDKNELWMRVWCLLLECVPGLRHNVFRRVGTLEGYTSPAEIEKWQQRTIVIE